MSGSDQALNEPSKVSEHTKVYWDLPAAIEETAMSRQNRGGSNVKFTLQTIHQKVAEELKNDPYPSVGFGPAAFSLTKSTGGTKHSSSTYESSSSSAYGTGGAIYSVFEQHSGPSSTIRITKRQSSFESVYPPDALELPPPNSFTLTTDTTIQVFDREVSKMKNFIVKLTSDSPSEQTGALADILHSLQSAWTTPQYGRNLAYTLCDALRSEGGLKSIINNCTSKLYEILLGSARVLSQCLTNPNRDYLVKEQGLPILVTMSTENKNDQAMLAATTGILEGLFKHSKSTCQQLVELGGLGLMLFSCRSADKCTLRNCAMGLANLALYGGAENHEAMMRAKVPDWLFPLAFSGDDVVRYYACMAICALTVNKELAPVIQKSGTMALVEPFIIRHSPVEFARSASIHFQGKADDWLERLVPMLKSESRQSQSLAAFHFAMEASVKAEQNNIRVLYDIGAIQPLKEVAVSPNKLASRFACEALQILGEQIPYTLSSQVPLWSKIDVQNWIKQIGFGEYAEKFCKLNVDGDMLLSLTQENLRDDIGMQNGIIRQRFLRSLTDLKLYADYTSCDTSNVCKWLVKVDPRLLQYAYSMLSAGLTMEMIPNISDEHLKCDCGVTNGIHRLKMLQAAEGKINIQHSFARSLDVIEDTATVSSAQTLDVFISYRRSTGSQLASLLKVHLQLRGFTVFLDIEKLAAGRFDDRLLSSVKQAKNFILVLTPGALERCVNDDLSKDWVHREIVAALKSECNIVPVMDDFTWPTPDQLPEDMRNITRFNGVRWIHDYQDACVDKLEHFLRGGRFRMSPPAAELPTRLAIGDKQAQDAPHNGFNDQLMVADSTPSQH